MKNNNNTPLILKAKIIAILLLFLVVKSLPVIGQTRVTRYTPLSSPVTAYNQMPGMSSDDKNNWSSYVKTNYPSATELNKPSATNNYNCHGYAWHVSEGGDQVWIGLGNYDPNPYIMEDIFWEDGSYIRLNSESGADKISYYNGNHSAIQTSTTGTYHSKWGPGPLMEHARDYGPAGYQMNNRYYYDEPVISGTNSICYPSTQTYSVQDFYNVTYNWSTSSNLQINGSNTNRTVSISSKSTNHGSGYVRVSIYIPAYNKTRVITKNVHVGITASFTGSSSVLYLKTGTWTGSASCGTAPYNYDWFLRKDGTGMGAVLVATGNPLTLRSVKAGTSYLSTEKASDPIINQPITQTIFYLYARAFDANGNVYVTPEQRIVAYGNVDLVPAFMPYMQKSASLSENQELNQLDTYLEVYPNPVSDNLTINIVSRDEEKSDNNVSITIFDSYMSKMKVFNSNSKENILNISNLRNGIYIVQVQYGENQWTEKILVE